MEVKTKFNKGDIVYYITEHGVINSYCIDSIEIELATSGNLFIIYNGIDKYNHYNESKLYATKDEAKQILIDKIKAM